MIDDLSDGIIEELDSLAHTFLSGNLEFSKKLDNLLLNFIENDTIYLDGFDDEQIFQQIEALYTRKALENECELFVPSLDEEEDYENDEEDPIDNDKSVEENDGDVQDHANIEGDGESDEAFSEGLDDLDDEEANDLLEKRTSKIFKKSEIDDQFFSLREMEEVCEEQEKQDGDLLDEEMYDELYANEPEDLLADDDKKDNIMHDDFFKSTFEKRNAKLREELEVLEAEQVAPKPWHLMGEADAKKREADALLGLDLDYDISRTATVPTVEKTEELENIIIQRIRDKAYDDVERKTREMIEPAEAIRKAIPDEERKSLSQMYEQEFLQNNKDTDEDPERKKIKDNMQKLFAQLDFLTYDTVVNQKEIEVKVLSNVSALVSEEKGPSMMSGFASLAPEEVGGKSKGAFKIKEERTTEEIKKDRRKIKQKIKARKAAGKEIKFRVPKKKTDADLRPNDGKKTKWTNSAKVFRLLQSEAETGALSQKAKLKAKKVQMMQNRKAKSFKL